MQGEISNLTDHYRSGHIYMTLKDDKAAIKAVMFAGNARRLKFRPEDGMNVIVRGRVTLYEVTGSYQFIIEDMQPYGTGAVNLAFEQLKKKLREEGLFDEKHKKPLPAYPKRIGVITSPTGDALQDILRILGRRYPIGEIVLCPVLVQGENAPAQLTEAVKRFDRAKCAEVIIIGRGGGSAEDLWAFNDEALARAVFECTVPVISAVGHETDFTICDFVSDVRASTPSAAAELVSPDMEEMLGAAIFYYDRLTKIMNSRLKTERLRLDRVCSRYVMRSPLELVHSRRMKLDMLSDRLTGAYESALLKRRSRLSEASAKLDALSPLKVLSRGYAIAEKDKTAVRSVSEVQCGDNIDVILKDGSLGCTVCTRREIENEEKA